MRRFTLTGATIVVAGLLLTGCAGASGSAVVGEGSDAGIDVTLTKLADRTLTSASQTSEPGDAVCVLRVDVKNTSDVGVEVHSNFGELPNGDHAGVLTGGYFDKVDGVAESLYDALDRQYVLGAGETASFQDGYLCQAAGGSDTTYEVSVGSPNSPTATITIPVTG